MTDGLRVAITGGAGFLGARLTQAMLDLGTLAPAGEGHGDVASIRLLDRVAPPEDLATDPRVEPVVGELTDALARGALRNVDVVVHLAAAVSGECERDLDLGLVNNLDASRLLLDTCRQLGTAPILVFASSVAVFGGVPGQPLPDVVVDSTMPIPRSSYGSQKVMVEYLVSDYSRRGHVRGRTVRLMTVTVRPGRPNAAASSFVSGIIREPLNGERSVCPVPPETELAVSSPRRSIEGVLLACTASDEAWGPAAAMNLPALTVTPREMAAAMDRVAGHAASDLIDWAIDPAVVDVVASWPSRFRTDRANALGLTAEPDFDTIVHGYVAER
jgi:nucleoside-diphosphate-sugar epimerase